MTFSTIIYSLQDGVAKITFNRPDRLNALTRVMQQEIGEALGQVEASDAGVLLITGAGRGFCAGQDLEERKQLPGQPPPDLGASLDRWNPLVRQLAELKMPVVAAVNGVAVGAGANLALACDLVVAKRSARFIQVFTSLGLMPDAGGTWVLPRLVGQARAMGLALTAEPLSGSDAEAWGLIWRAYPDEAFDQEVAALVGKLAAAPTVALHAAKRAIRRAFTAELEDQLKHEREVQDGLVRSPEYAEAVRAFHEKRPANFRQRTAEGE